MNWLRIAKPKREVKKVSIPQKPKAPAKESPPKPAPKKYFTGPKDPMGYKRKLYIPRKFIVAGLDIKASGEDDYSEFALRFIEDQAGGLVPITVKWVSEVGTECPKCSTLSGQTWHNVSSFLSGREFHGSGCGIYGYSHPTCKCHLLIEVNDGEGRYVIEPSDAHPQYRGGDTIQSIYERMSNEKVERSDDMLKDDLVKDWWT
jgi:hypothetical protein